MLQERESRPAGNQAAQDLADTPSVPATTDDDLDAAHAFFRTSYAVLVRGKSVRRHLYFNLPAAERAIRRAEARGDHAELILVRLVPVDARHLDGPVVM